MKKTKKLFAVGMAAALISVIAVPVFAETGSAKFDSQTKSTSFDVKGTYKAGGSAGTVYSVDITWGSMDFTYTAASDGDWNPETHSYSGGSAGAWGCDDGANIINVTNHSNAAVNVKFAYNSETSYSDISGSFTNSDTLNLNTAVGTAFGEAPSGSVTLGLSGDLPSTATEGVKIGTVTVTLAE